MLDKLLSLFFYPLGLSLVSGFMGLGFLLARRRKAALVLGAFSLGWLLFWSLPPVTRVIAAPLERQTPDVPVEKVPAADVILVFGGVMRSALPGRSYPDLGAGADRVWHAARLYKAGKAPKVLLSGGRFDWLSNGPSEAQTMSGFLTDLGVPPDAIFLEERSRNTWENARFCAQRMRERGFQRALLVTSALHMPRSRAVAKAAGIDFVPVATDYEATLDDARIVLDFLPNVQALQRSTHALHEWVGLAVYSLRGWL